MGLRFRRSVKILPGVRLNVSASGVSATIGPRGASVNVGPRGTYANLGLPGTGLSYRQRLDSSPSRASSRSTYRGLVRELREAERARAIATALDEHARHEALLGRLGGVLSERQREPYPWMDLWGPRGAFKPEAFRSPERNFSEVTAADVAARTAPIMPWSVPAAILLGVALWLGSPIYKVLAAVGTIALVVWLRWSLDVRRRLAADLLRAQNEEFARDLELLETDHRLRQAAASEAWDREEELRAAVRSAEQRGDVELLSSILEAELSNEDLPVPLVFELEMESPYDARIELSLPELDEVPEERTQLTKTGKLSIRRFAQRDRVGLYADLCAGIALRLVHETFRVLPMVSVVEIFGTATGPDPATGHDREFVALHLRTDRSSFLAINLDAADPSSALSGLGGRLNMDRKGMLIPITGVVGLRDN